MKNCASKSTSDADSLKDLTILIVDDHEDIRDTAAQILSSFGAKVETALDGADALAKTQSHHYDCILMDIRMPGLDGNTTARMISARGSDAQNQAVFIALTGEQATSSLTSNAFPFDGWLFKPIKPFELTRCIQHSLSSRRMQGNR